MEEFDNLLREQLNNNIGIDAPEKYTAPCHKRLHRALIDMRTDPQSVGVADLAGLVRHVLRYASLRGSRSVRAAVPSDDGWPDKELWRKFGVESITGSEGRLLVSAKPWSCDWLDTVDGTDPFEDALAERPRRINRPVPIDPLLRVAGMDVDQYLSAGQQMAVRSAFLCNPGSTLVVNLPTGGGKSLVFTAAAIVGAGEGALTLVVVPTTALALDHERRTRNALESALASSDGVIQTHYSWHSGLDSDARTEIKRRIYEGSQPILFASPESVLGPLARVLIDSNLRGALRFFVIDEAHVVGEWGDEFRPHFQALAGFRDKLLRESKSEQSFRTLLLSATLTEESFRVLQELFGAPGPLNVVSATHLRPEPSYWIHHCHDRDEQEERVLELARVAPRPLILYVTRPIEAEKWGGILKDMGFRRYAVVHGSTTTERRAEIIERWQDNRIDMVVATSAFGLGMDHSQVRTIIHACVPETIDRYYQEVGRGGRDGNASLSFLVYTDDDRDCAIGMGRKRIITIDRGWERWDRMYRSSTQLEQNSFHSRLCVDLRTQPSGVYADTDYNEIWNLRTLTLMSRAGLISIEPAIPPQIDERVGELEKDYHERLQEAIREANARRIVRINSGGHGNRDTWSRIVEPTRAKLNAGVRRHQVLLHEMIRSRTEMSKLLREVYTIEGQRKPEAACGGCPECRRRGRPYLGYAEPLPSQTGDFDAPVGESLTSALGVSNPEFLLLTYPVDEGRYDEWRDQCILPFIDRCVDFGIREVAAPQNWRQLKPYINLFHHSPNKFLVYTDIGETFLPGSRLGLPRISIVEPTDPPRPLPDHLFDIREPMHIIVMPANTPDRARPDRLLKDVTISCSELMTVMRRLDSGTP